jgi:hypothetical protein
MRSWFYAAVLGATLFALGTFANEAKAQIYVSGGYYPSYYGYGYTPYYGGYYSPMYSPYYGSYSYRYRSTPYGGAYYSSGYSPYYGGYYSYGYSASPYYYGGWRTGPFGRVWWR